MMILLSGLAPHPEGSLRVQRATIFANAAPHADLGKTSLFLLVIKLSELLDGGCKVIDRASDNLGLGHVNSRNQKAIQRRLGAAALQKINILTVFHRKLLDGIPYLLSAASGTGLIDAVGPLGSAEGALDDVLGMADMRALGIIVVDASALDPVHAVGIPKGGLLRIGRIGLDGLGEQLGGEGSQLVLCDGTACVKTIGGGAGGEE
jgi:hypothetical protein